MGRRHHDQPYDFGVEEGESVASMRARLAESGPAFLTEVRTIADAGRLDETFVDAICDPPEVFTYGGMIAPCSRSRPTAGHSCGALVDAGVTDLGAGDPMRWVAEPA